ncbi:DNA helicase [Clostridium botulinum]|nr:DNA helicase [Clostridium botulinum]
MHMKRVSEVVTVEEIKKWTIGDVVTITASMGAGKSYFIKNILYAFAKANNKKILYLIHRDNCNNQFLKELKKDKKTDIIDIKTYQKLEWNKLNKIENDLSKYEYIVCDEFHYFLSDSIFNKKTDISFNIILKNTTAIKIFMSATADKIKTYMNTIENIKLKQYELPISYDFIEDLSFYNDNAVIEKLLKNIISKNEKAIFFINDIEYALDLHRSHKKHTLFNCSKSNEKYRYVDVEKINDMLENEKFNENILITTSCLDSGVNIIDTKVKYIVCDIKDIGSLIQCLGRKRMKDIDDKVHVYIKNINNKSLGGIKKNLNDKLELAKFLRFSTVKELVGKYERYEQNNCMVYDVAVDEDDKCTKKINSIMYFKCTTDIDDINYMLSLSSTYSYYRYGYCKFIADKLGFKDNYKFLEDKNEKLEDYLGNILGQTMLQVKDRKELINKIDVRSNGKQLKKIDNLNGALEEMGIPYRIIQFKTSRMIEGKQKKYNSAWRVERLVSNII